MRSNAGPKPESESKRGSVYESDAIAAQVLSDLLCNARQL